MVVIGKFGFGKDLFYSVFCVVGFLEIFLVFIMYVRRFLMCFEKLYWVFRGVGGM